MKKIGRKAPTEAAREVISKLEKNGVQVHVAQADVSNKEQLDRVLREINELMPPLKGIIHAAGILDDGVLMHQTWERFTRVMAPKVAGAWNLHVLTEGVTLDFFVLFSSISSLWGTPGQGNYSAANAYLDGLAYFRRAKRLPCVSANWGSWAEVGMAAELDSNIQQKKKMRGLGAIDLESGLNILGRMICSDSVQSAVIDVNWAEYAQQFSAGTAPAFFSEILKEKTQHVKEDKGQYAKQSGLLLQIEKAPVSQREQILSTHVKAETAKLLGLDPGESLDPQRPLTELGLDSLSAIELRNAFEFSIGQPLPATLLYDYPTLENVSAYLADKIIPKETVTDTPPEDSGKGSEDNEISRESESKPSDQGEPSLKEKPNDKLSSVSNTPNDGPSVRDRTQSEVEAQVDILHNEELLSMMPIHTKGSMPPFFFIHGSPLSMHLHLGMDQPIYYFGGLWKEGNLSSEICIEDIALVHLKEMKTVQPKGPYFLGGYSIGGLIAYEVAQQLQRQGEEVALLFLLEPISPYKFSFEKFAEDIPLKYKEKRHYLSRNKLYKFLGRITFDVAFSGFNSLLKSRIPLFSALRSDCLSVLLRLCRNKKLAQTRSGRRIIRKVKQVIVNSGLSLPPDFRKNYVKNLYIVALKNYCAHTYTGRIVIYKVKQESSVEIFAWEQLAGAGIEMKEMDLKEHLDPIATENNPVWVNGLKDYLERAQANCSVKTK